MEENQAFPKVDLHYNGTFVPNPLVYFAPEVLRLNEDANEFVFSDFIKYVEKLIDFQCKHVYYCIPEVRLSEGIQTLQNECNYSEFLEVANANKHVDVYIDHDNEPIFEWIQKEEPDDEELVYSEEDADSVLADDENCEHEEDESVTSSKRIFKRTYNDKFLNKLCPVVVADEDEEGNELPAVYPRHDATQEWRKMKPKLGPSTPTPSAPTHVNQDPLTQEHVPVNQELVIQEHVPVNQELVIQENVPVNQERVNEDLMNQVPVNEVPINQYPVNPIHVNQVPVNLGVRVPKSLGVRARKPSERINKIQIRKQVFRKDDK
ncbi:unnamed protein product [Lactuca virosa]|uniref:Uncharacterized protein n=1 Tax=Lactuca virosa TaxID=75947 RepID=A0AAU9P133_9ASTR|nr:unnamed protein product [Lactuca virosa]